jgi:hypothetical protein
MNIIMDIVKSSKGENGKLLSSLGIYNILTKKTNISMKHPQMDTAPYLKAYIHTTAHR